MIHHVHSRQKNIAGKVIEKKGKICGLEQCIRTDKHSHPSKPPTWWRHLGKSTKNGSETQNKKTANQS